MLMQRMTGEQDRQTDHFNNRAEQPQHIASEQRYAAGQRHCDDTVQPTLAAGKPALIAALAGLVDQPAKQHHRMRHVTPQPVRLSPYGINDHRCQQDHTALLKFSFGK